MDAAVEKAYSDFREATDRLHLVLDQGAAAIAREYFRSAQRPIDEATRERLKSIAEQMQACIKKRVPPSVDALNTWAIALTQI